MLAWFFPNIGTILISLVLVGIVTMIIMKLKRDRQKGKSACGCDCTHCSICNSCRHG